MPQALTELEQRVLDYLFEYLRRNTYQPSVREIGAEFSIKSTKTVSEVLQALADKGWVERDPARSRGVRLLGLDTGVQPVLVHSLEGAETLQIDRRLAGAAGTFVAAMRGDHLRGDGVLPGDLLLVEPVDPTEIETDDIVHVEIAGAATARRCVREAADLILDPIAGEQVAVSLTPRQAAIVIRGRVTTVIRRIRPPAARSIAENADTTATAAPLSSS